MRRGKYQGVLQIVAYHRGFYGATFMGVAIAAAVSIWLPATVRVLILTAVGIALLWTLGSLAVSHFVYDRSSLYSLDWLTLRPNIWLHLHAGLDEMSDLLRERLPGSASMVFDIFDPEQMTEPSIARARELAKTSASSQVSWRNLPVESDRFDAVFLIFTAHELRITEARHVFFREVARVLKPGGSLFLLEHLRDLPNFLAFGPGFLHFQSRRTWEAAFHASGLTVVQERSITPFVHVFEVRKGSVV